MGIFSNYDNDSIYLTESRSDLDDSDFGLPSKRKYPINDKKHILLAIKFFNYVDDSDEKELADNIIKKAKILNMIDDINVGENNKFGKYFKKEINESSLISIIQKSSISDKRYRCPYCKYIDTKQNLISHIEKFHSFMIPQNYTAARLLFNYFNKKDHGTCVQCGKETAWNENTMRYERFCSNPKCKKAYADEFHKIRMVNKYGVENLLNDPNMQQKMLANRSISGSYKFKDGGEKTYTGSYEKNLLEFFDQYLDSESQDIDAPGPVFKYTFKEKELFWITDFYYAPANLIIEVKDGGNNPNNRDMKEYREKQLAKEDMIKKNGKYNYIRLTNNNFEQFIDVLMDIKYSLMNNVKEPVIHVNESLLKEAHTASGMEVKNYDNNPLSIVAVDITSIKYNLVNNGKLDARLKTRIENYDANKEKLLLESNNIVEEYNNLINGDIDRALNNIKKVNNLKTQDEIIKYVNSNISDHSIYSVFELLKIKTNMSDSDIKKYIKDNYYDNSTDPEYIKQLLKLRLNYNKRMTYLFQKMLMTNYQLLGLDRQEATELMITLDHGENNSITKIKKIILDNKSKFQKRPGFIDLRSLGFGIFISTEEDTGLEYSTALDKILQYLMRYDCVVLAHGGDSSLEGMSQVVDGLMNDAANNPDLKKNQDFIDTVNQYKKMFNNIKNNKTDWYIQPTKSESGKTFVLVDDLLRELIKEGHKKILVLSCNPGHHKIAPDILAKKGVFIHYSNNSTLIEETIDDYDDTIDILNCTESDLLNICYENNINYENNEYLLECYDNIDNNIDSLNELSIREMWEALKELVKKIIAAIVYAAKMVIEFIRNMINKLRNFIKPDDKKYTTVSSCIFVENAIIKSQKVTNSQYRDIVMHSCNVISQKLNQFTRRQNTFMEDNKREIDKLSKEVLSMNENAASNAIPQLNKSYIIQYRVPASPTFIDDKDYIGFSDNITDSIYIINDDGELIKENFAGFMIDKNYNVYQIKNYDDNILNSNNIIKDLIESVNIDFADSYVHSDMLTLFKLQENEYTRLYYSRIINEATINNLSLISLPTLYKFKASDKIENCSIMEDENGYFARHYITSDRTPSFKTIDELYDNLNMIKYLDYKY